MHTALECEIFRTGERHTRRSDTFHGGIVRKVREQHRSFDRARLFEVVYEILRFLVSYTDRGKNNREFIGKMTGVLSDLEYRVTTMYVDGFSVSEICEATGKTPKSVDNALQRSKKKLTGSFKEEAAEKARKK